VEDQENKNDFEIEILPNGKLRLSRTKPLSKDALQKIASLLVDEQQKIDLNKFFSKETDIIFGKETFCG
jgi:hypothetical protein